jgi:RNA polymerase sigma-70 factor (ECF subfamily)
MSSTLFNRPDELIRRVHAYVAYRIGEGHDAEDVTSATIERAYRYRTSYDPELGEPIAWLLGIASRCIRDAVAERRELIPTDPTDLPVAWISDHADTTVDRIAVLRALSRVSERDRDLIAMRYGADLTAAQIARLTGAKTNAVEVSLHRALGRLRAVIDESTAPDEEAVDYRGAVHPRSRPRNA